MIWNCQFAYLHYPKAAGKSLTRAFLEAWDCPIKGLISPGQVSELRDCMRPGIDLRVDRSHQNAKMARRILRRDNLDLAALKAVFVSVRDPYDLMVSTYAFLRSHAPGMPDHPSFTMAAKLPFDEFVVAYPVPVFQNWTSIDGQELGNLCLLRFETLAQDFAQAADRYGFRHVAIPHLNASNRNAFPAQITPELEAVIYDKFRYLFDKQLYKRRAFAAA